MEGRRGGVRFHRQTKQQHQRPSLSINTLHIMVTANTNPGSIRRLNDLKPHNPALEHTQSAFRELIRVCLSVTARPLPDSRSRHSEKKNNKLIKQIEN